MMRLAWRALLRLATLVVLSTISLQLYFLARIALMMVVDPQSTTFQRSEAWRLLVDKGEVLWSQQWVDYERISPNLKRAVIASEDAAFAEHSGVDWDAIEKAWERNQRAEERIERLNLLQERRSSKAPAGRPAPAAPPPARRTAPRPIRRCSGRSPECAACSAAIPASA